MAIFVTTDARIYLGKYSLAAHTRSIELGHKAAALDKTTMGNTTKVNVGGLKEIALTAAGFNDFATDGIDPALITTLAVSDSPITLSPDGADVGEVAYFFKALHTDYAPISATIGEVVPYNLAATASSGALVRGVIGAVGSKTSTSAGADQVLGAVTAGHGIYAALHVLSVTGTNPTLDVIIESDADGDFGAGATTRLTFDQVTAAGSAWEEAVGAVTDTHWRVSWTIGGTDTPTFDIVVALGIL